LAEPELQVLASQGCLNAFLGVRRGNLGMYVLTVQSRSPVVIRSSPGGTFPLHSTAMGKALMIGLDRSGIISIVGKNAFERFTPRTLTDPDKLIEQIQAAEKTGYATSLDEHIAGLIAVGAPLRDLNGTIVGAISVAYPRSVGPHIAIAEVGEKITVAAARISVGLGYHGPSQTTGEAPSHAA
jgi:DNA-binding IclR family transcriptional regulator